MVATHPKDASLLNGGIKVDDAVLEDLALDDVALEDVALEDVALEDVALGSRGQRGPSTHRSDLAALSGVVGVLADVSVGRTSAAELRQLLTAAQKAKNAACGLVYRIASEADRLAAQGKAAPSEDFLNDDGKARASSSRQDSKRSKTVSELPGIADAATSGEIGTDQIDSLNRRLKDLTPRERKRIDFAWLIDKAKNVSADRFDKVLREAAARARDDGGLSDANNKRSTSEFRHWFNHKTGMGRFTGQLDPLRYEALTTAIDQHVASLAAAASTENVQSVSKDQALAATALVELACSSGQRSRHLPHVTVVVDAETLSSGPHDGSIQETGNGHQLAAETTSRLCCDAVIQKVTLDDSGLPINVGRKYRTATATQWTALQALYSTCAWGGCDRPLSWCQLHHIDYWRNGGRTDLDNLLPVCDRHHHMLHEGGWTIKLQANRAATTHRPDGRIHSTGAPPSRRPESTRPPNQAQQRQGQGAEPQTRKSRGKPLDRLESENAFRRKSSSSK